MAKLGIILACPHYPEVSDAPERLDAQLRLWLAAEGTVVNEIVVYAAFEGDQPQSAKDCDAWIVSGVPLFADAASEVQFERLLHVLRQAGEQGRPLYAVHHGEHVLHAAFGGSEELAPETRRFIRSIRNPFRSFVSRDALHCFDAETRRVQRLERPEHLQHKSFFGALLRAA